MRNKGNTSARDGNLALFMCMGMAVGTAMGGLLDRPGIGISLGIAAGSLAFLMRSRIRRHKR